MRQRSLYFLPILGLLLAVGLWLPRPVKAVNVWGDWFDRTVGQRGFADIGFGRNDPRVITANVINIALGLLGVVAIVLILYAGFIWMTAAGNADKIEIAKKILASAGVGLLIVLSAWAIAIYILSRLWLATGAQGNIAPNQSCAPDGLTSACGCGGERICQGGQWGECVGSDCSDGLGGERRPCDANQLTPQCDADNTACGASGFCDLVDCRCSQRRPYGQSCDGQAGDGQCQADNTLCQPGLTCDSAQCLCVGGAGSNEAQPTIVSVEPATGASGQYVTIRGLGFGWSRQASQVLFGATEADYNFPAVCAASVWGDNEIVVKVPKGLADGSVKVAVVARGVRAEAPTDFQIDSHSSITPGLCRLEPPVGQIDDAVSLWGENFDSKNNSSQIVFNAKVIRTAGEKICWGGQKSGQACAVNADCPDGNCSAAISAWGVDKTAQGQARPDLIKTKIPLGALSGSVQIGKGQPAVFSNSLNLTIGQCTQDNQCGGGNVCCPVGTPGAGHCQASSAECYGAADSCVYEWQFSTGNNNRCPPDKPNACQDGSCCRSACVADPTNGLTTCQDNSSCAGYGGNACLNSLLCPNSPGNCSFNSQTVITGATCSCSLLGYGQAQYDNVSNRCVSQQSCSLSEKVTVNGRTTDKYCALYQGQAHWQISASQTCPTGYTPTYQGSKLCVDLKSGCDLCSANFVCSEVGGQGRCVGKQAVCPNNFECTNQVCSRPAGTCECCCDKTQNQPDQTNPACCAPLNCVGSCGSGANFGYCGGCANVGDTQAEHDAACNCSGHSGKYCDTSVAGGVCRDCAQIGDPAACSSHDACCVNAKQGQACVGVLGSKFLDSDNLAYCAFYNCGDKCTAPAKDGAYDTAAKCQNGCQLSCDGNEQQAGCQKNANLCPSDKPFCNDQCQCQAEGLPAESSCATKEGACTLVCDQPYACRGEKGGQGPGQPDAGTCLCCCNPFNKSSDPTAPDFDKCRAVGSTGKLFCQENVGACTGGARGLCCGCQADSDCGDAAAVGCGKDACCHNRPKVEMVEPANNSQEVCRNSLIRVKFNGLINEGSLSGNMIVVGDYGSSLCPAGTTLLAVANPASRPANFFSRLWQAFKSLLSGLANSASAATAHNFCAATGQVVGGDFVNNKAKKTMADFLLSAPLSPNITYYIIVKGYTDQGGGVKDSDGVGLNEVNQTAMTSFNGLTYPNAYIWQFTTGADLCLLDHVAITPNQHLFQRAADNYPVNAEALDAANKPLVSLPLYGWVWSWRSDDSSVAGVKAKDEPVAYEATVTSGAKGDAETFVYARATINADMLNPISTIGKYKEGRAKMIAFFCDNPWPVLSDPDAWPVRWADTDGNCAICTDPATQKTRPCQPNDCLNNHFEFYYCRDQAASGTKDDLPALNQTPPVRGRYKYQGSGAWVDVLKDFYFFRVALPAQPSGLTASLTAAKLGGEAKLTWPTVRDTTYIVYYGTTEGDYRDHAAVGAAGSTVISHLSNDQDYYFAVTATNLQHVESDYSAAVKLRIEDKISPDVVNGATANVVRNNGNWGLNFNWARDTSEAVTYRLSYGPYDPPAVSLSVGSVTSYSVNKLDNLANQDYHLGLAAVDAFGNQSAPVRWLCTKGCSSASCACQKE